MFKLESNLCVNFQVLICVFSARKILRTILKDLNFHVIISVYCVFFMLSGFMYFHFILVHYVCVLFQS
jgi:hypothetical protein